MVSNQGTESTPNWGWQCPGRGMCGALEPGDPPARPIPTRVGADDIGPTSSAAGDCRAPPGAPAQHIPGTQVSSRDLRLLAQGGNAGPASLFPCFSTCETGPCTAIAASTLLHHQGPETGLTLPGQGTAPCPLKGWARIHFAGEQRSLAKHHSPPQGDDKRAALPFLPGDLSVPHKGRGTARQAEHEAAISSAGTVSLGTQR